MYHVLCIATIITKTGVHGKLAARNIIFSFYKFGGAKTGLDDGWGGWDFVSQQGQYIFSVLQKSRPSLRSTLPFNGHRGFLSRVKRPECEAELTPSSAEVKNEWTYTSIPLTTWIGEKILPFYLLLWFEKKYIDNLFKILRNLLNWNNGVGWRERN